METNLKTLANLLARNVEATGKAAATAAAVCAAAPDVALSSHDFLCHLAQEVFTLTRERKTNDQWSNALRTFRRAMDRRGFILSVSKKFYALVAEGDWPEQTTVSKRFENTKAAEAAAAASAAASAAAEAAEAAEIEIRDPTGTEPLSAKFSDLADTGQVHGVSLPVNPGAEQALSQINDRLPFLGASQLDWLSEKISTLRREWLGRTYTPTIKAA